MPDLSTSEIVLGGICMMLFSTLAAIVMFGGKAVRQEVQVAIHKWAAGQAAALSKLGLSPMVTQPFTELAAGDDAAAIGSGVAAVRYLEQEDNRIKEGLSVAKHLLSVAPDQAKAALNDLLTGAPDDQTIADLKKLKAAVPELSQLQPGPVFQHLEQIGSQLDAIAKTPGASLSNLMTLLGSNPVIAPVVGPLLSILKAGHSIGVQNQPAPPSSSAAAAPANNALAPASPTGGASTNAPAAVSTAVQGGHMQINALLPPGATLPAVSNPA